MDRRSLVPPVIGLLSLTASGWNAWAEPPLVELRQFFAEQRYPEVLEQVDAFVNETSGWALSFDRQVVELALLGHGYGYFSVRARTPRPPILPVAARHRPEGGEGYDALYYVTCVELRSGKPVWTRSFLPHPELGIDPRDDSLWVLHEDRWEQIEAVAGDTRLTGPIAQP